MIITHHAPMAAAGVGRPPGLRGPLGWGGALVLALMLAAQPAAAASDCQPDGGVPCAKTAEETPAKPATAKEAAADAKATPRTAETKATPKAERQAPKSNEIVWFFQNNYGRQIEYKLYAWNRNWSWPGGNRVFVLPANRRTYKTKIQCQRGEKVCYGAWQSSNRRVSWGVGYNARFNCNNCCFTCKGVETPTFIFRP